MENVIIKDRNLLVVLQEALSTELQELMRQFCGEVVRSVPAETDKRMYICGDISKAGNAIGHAYIIKELSENYDAAHAHLITLGEVPVVISNAGVYFKQLFTGDDYFDKIKSEHAFQELTESNKPSKAFRKAIYLSDITKEENGALNFNLLRCSSNLTGPTDNFRTTDRHIINRLNEEVKYVFGQETKLNHVLAQIYENKAKTEDSDKEIKSRIKAHSDKTKDMPKEGLIAFCTFYDKIDPEHLKPSATDRFDRCYKETTGFTKLFFKLKSTVTDESLDKEFSVTLYPNSVFMIPLSTNRLYTHEIRPSMLNVGKIPTRLGYVVRCSALEAQYVDNQTYIKENGAFIALEKMTPATQQELKDFYYDENISEQMVQYGKIHFSMNEGDYEQPIF